MHDKRRYKRFKLNELEVNGKMALATEVKVIDISISGISLKVNRRLNIDSDYTLKLEGIKTITLRGTVIWCSLIEIRKASEEEAMPLYSAGMQFKDITDENLAELQSLIESHKIEEIHVIGGTRLNVRFHIKDPTNTILIGPDDYKVKIISLGGMLIECLQNFDIESRIHMEMFIDNNNPIKFVGRVASSQVINKDGPMQYDIGIEFLDMTEGDRKVLASFIEHSAMADTKISSEMETTSGESSGDHIPIISKDFIDKIEFLYKWHTTLDYYAMLDIKEYATDEQIRQAFFRKTNELNPDKFHKVPDDLKQKLNTLLSYFNVARSTLLDPQKRKEYGNMKKRL